MTWRGGGFAGRTLGGWGGGGRGGCRSGRGGGGFRGRGFFRGGWGGGNWGSGGWWAFKEEAVARAIVASKIPIGTGIGHEPDTTIADLVGDLRGPTPTGVTELTIPDVNVLCSEISAKGALLTRDMRRMLDLRGG